MRFRATFGVALLAVVAEAQETTRVSVNSAGVEGNSYSSTPAVSANGQAVAFWSPASNLVAGDTGGYYDIFVHDRSTGLTERISVDSAGAQANYHSYSPSISADGKIVAFESWAKNLVAGDTNMDGDIFVHDRSTGLTERVSVDSSGAEADGYSYGPSISADGQTVAFFSAALNLVPGDTNWKYDVFVHDRSTGITERISVNAAGAEANGDSFFPAISADGQTVVFQSWANNLVAGDTNAAVDVFVYDRSTGLTERVSVDSSGTEGNSDSYTPAISADGQIVAFYSDAWNLVAGDTNWFRDVFVHDCLTGVTARVSVDSSGTEAIGESYNPSISADGQMVAFWSYADNLVTGDSNLHEDVFVHDRVTGHTERVSVDSSGKEGNHDSGTPSISADGRVVAFWSYAENLVAGDTNGTADVFVHRRDNASWSNYATGFPGTNGVPSFTAQAPPALGSTLSLDLANSWGIFTNGLVFLGFQRTTIPTSWGGDLLVVPVITQLIGVDAGGGTLAGTIPNDPAFIGVTVDLQAIELDPGAAKGMSFTPGLELVFGH